MSIVNELKADIRQYADHRISDVRRGAETPELAGLIVAKYGLGLSRALRAMGESDASIWRQSSDFQSFVDQQVERIDPDWRETDRKRWASKPASLTVA